MKVKCAIDKNAPKTASTDGLTEAEKKVILDRHNTLRCGLSAKNMNILKWNCDLETMAKCFAKRCDILIDIPSKSTTAFFNPRTSTTYDMSVNNHKIQHFRNKQDI